MTKLLINHDINIEIRSMWSRLHEPPDNPTYRLACGDGQARSAVNSYYTASSSPEGQPRIRSGGMIRNGFLRDRERARGVLDWTVINV